MREKIMEMEQYAAEYNVPIIEKESIAFTNLAVDKNITLYSSITLEGYNFPNQPLLFINECFCDGSLP